MWSVKQSKKKEIHEIKSENKETFEIIQLEKLSQ